MPIEIRELIIKATIDNQLNVNQGSSNTSGTNSSQGSEQLISICVEKVLEIIKSKLER